MSYHYNHGINSHENAASIAANNAAGAAAASAAASADAACQAYAEAEDAERRATSARMDLYGEKTMSQSKIGELWDEISIIHKDILKLYRHIATGTGESAVNRRKIFELDGKVNSLQTVLGGIAEKVETNQEIQDIAIDMVISLRNSVISMAEKLSPEMAKEMKELSGYSEKLEDKKVEEDEEMALLEKLLPRDTKTFGEAVYDLTTSFTALKNMCLKYFIIVEGQEQFGFRPGHEEDKEFVEGCIKKNERDMTSSEIAALTMYKAANRRHANLTHEEFTAFAKEDEEAKNIVEDYRTWDCADTADYPTAAPHVSQITDRILASKEVAVQGLPEVTI